MAKTRRKIKSKSSKKITPNTKDTAITETAVTTSTDYYDSTKKKVIDFCYGFFGTALIVAILVMSNIESLFENSFILQQLAGIIFFGLNIAGIIIAFKKKRRYIALGILALYIIIPFLIGAIMYLSFTMYN